MNDNIAPVIDACPRCGHVLSSTSDDERIRSDNAETGLIAIACLVTLWAFGFGANFWIGMALFGTIVIAGLSAIRINRRRRGDAAP